MPITPTYPGVYIEEIPSGVRAITGVATSIAAFVGRARRGPVNRPVMLTSFADFERAFGGLWLDSSLSFAVRDFYQNGGSQAVVVRLYHAPATGDGLARLKVDGLTLTAAEHGGWGNGLRARVDYDTRPLQAGEAADSLFNLAVRDPDTGQVEQLRNLSITTGHPRQVDRVLANESRLVRASGVPSARPAKSLSDPTRDPWGDNTPATNWTVQTADKVPDDAALNQTDLLGSESGKTGLYALLKASLVNIVCIPPYTSAGTVDASVVANAATFCEARRAFLLIDPPDATGIDAATAAADGWRSGSTSLGTAARNAALFFPRLRQANPLRGGALETFVPCGAVAGVLARTDAQRGVWKAPAGLDASLAGVSELIVQLTDLENGQLNPVAVNCLRTMPGVGPVVWGARTLAGDDRLASEWKYIPVRRLALFIEESLYRGTQWVVFEPNDEPLWGQIRLNVGAFMQTLFRQGAFQGQTAREAYRVKCDRETTTQADIDRGVVNILVGFAPLKPAEFVFVQIQQLAGQVAA